eukprot:RCo023118
MWGWYSAVPHRAARGRPFEDLCGQPVRVLRVLRMGAYLPPAIDSPMNFSLVNLVTDFSARCSHTTTVFLNLLWTTGGVTAMGPSNQTWYSPCAALQWTPTPGAAFPQRYHHTSVVLDDRLLVLGGRGATGPLRDV